MNEELRFEEDNLSDEDIEFLNRLSEEQQEFDELTDIMNPDVDDWETDPEKKDQ